MKNSIARVDVFLQAAPEAVWTYLTTPDLIRQYMFGAEVDSEWKRDSPIRWTGVFNGKKFEDEGTVLEAVPGKLLSYTHMTAGNEGKTHQVTIRLEPENGGTALSLEQDNNTSEDEKRHAEENWLTMLTTLKGLLEKKP